MGPSKLLFDVAGIAALAYMAGGPAANVVLDRHVTPAPAEARSGSQNVDRDAAANQPVRRADDGLFYVTADVNGVPVRFLVDTGASVVVLRPQDARRAGVTTISGGGGARIDTASGVTQMRWARLDTIRVGGQNLHGLDAAVVGRGLPVSLMGQNLLTKIGPVSIDGNNLHLR